MNPSRFSLPRLLLLILAGLIGGRVIATPETKEAKDQRLAWFREARFGMFIHWGVYAVPAGEWNGRKYDGGVEWIQSKAGIPVIDYTPLKEKFNPVKYNAEAWVQLAKDAGMKYIVITTKHHDGFCLWDSAQTDWDVASSPYKNDLLKPLADACAKHGLRLCFYHSILDWHHPEYGDKKPWQGNAATAAPDMDKYTAYMKAQLRELLTNYGPIGIVWFDGEWDNCWTHERGIDLYDYIRGLQPATIVNNRVDKGRKGMNGMNAPGEFRGDYGTPEQEIPTNGLPGQDWESCMTMNETWGYSAHDHNWKSATVLIRNLIDIASKGGNYLLNVGPTGEGEIPAPSIDRLKEIGTWMKTNGEAIHGTAASPFPRALPWGRCTTRTLPDGKSRLYLHVFAWPENHQLTVPGLANEVISANLLGGPSGAVTASRPNGNLVLTLPAKAPSPIATVIALDIVGPPLLQPVVLRANDAAILILNADDAQIDGKHLVMESFGPEPSIGFWNDTEDTFSFPVAFDKAGPQAGVLRWSCPAAAAGSRIEVQLIDKDKRVVSTLPWTVTATDGWNNFKTQPLGVLAVPATGTYTVRFIALDKPGEGVLNFASLRFQPAE